MATTTQQFSQLLAPGLLKILFQELMQHEEEFSKFLNVTTSGNAYEEDQIIAGVGGVSVKREGAPVGYSDPIQGGTKRYIPTPYALGWQVTREMKDDDRYNIISRIPSELGRSMHEKIEQIGAAVLNGAFTTTTTANGVAMISTSQPLIGGGTYANRLSTDVDISVTSLQDMIILYENMVDERNRKMKMSPDELLIPPEQQFIAQTTLQSSMDPESGNRAINPVYGRLSIRVLHYLSSTRAWFLKSNKYNYARFVWRVKPEMESQDDFQTKGTMHTIYMRAVAGATDWRGWAGSNP